MIEQTGYMAEPTGGVNTPMVTIVAIKTPKWTGSKPTFCTIGRKIGVSSKKFTLLSRNIPRIKSHTRMMIISSCGWEVMPKIKFASAWGSLQYVTA